MNGRLLLVTRNFPPLTGGMERLNYHVYKELSQEFTISVAGPKGCQAFLSDNTAFKSFPPQPLFSFLMCSAISTFQLAFQEKPDLILAGSGSTGIAAFLVSRLFNAKAVVFLHGLDIVYPNPIYQFCFLPAIRKCDGILVNSNHTANLAKKYGISPDKITILNPGVSLPQNIKSPKKSILFNRKFGIVKNKRILLSVGRLTERKGLPEFIQNSLPTIVAECPDCILVIVGSEPSLAAHKLTGSVAKIQQATKLSGMENFVIMIGQINDNDLSEAYRSSDILIFPVLELPGDVEGFGMVAIEAAAHGLPTAAFAVGGIIDAIDHKISGWLVRSGNYQELNNCIINYLNTKNKKQDNNDTVSNIKCQNHAAKYSWDIFGHKLRQFCSNYL